MLNKKNRKIQFILAVALTVFAVCVGLVSCGSGDSSGFDSGEYGNLWEAIRSTAWINEGKYYEPGGEYWIVYLAADHDNWYHYFQKEYLDGTLCYIAHVWSGDREVETIVVKPENWDKHLRDAVRYVYEPGTGGHDYIRFNSIGFYGANKGPMASEYTDRPYVYSFESISGFGRDWSDYRSNKIFIDRKGNKIYDNDEYSAGVDQSVGSFGSFNINVSGSGKNRKLTIQKIYGGWVGDKVTYELYSTDAEEDWDKIANYNGGIFDKDEYDTLWDAMKNTVWTMIEDEEYLPLNSLAEFGITGYFNWYVNESSWEGNGDNFVIISYRIYDYEKGEYIILTREQLEPKFQHRDRLYAIAFYEAGTGPAQATITDSPYFYWTSVIKDDSGSLYLSPREITSITGNLIYYDGYISFTVKVSGTGENRNLTIGGSYYNDVLHHGVYNLQSSDAKTFDWDTIKNWFYD